MSLPRLAWQAALKKTKLKVDLLIDIDKKSIIGGISNSIYKHAKANNKYMKDYNKNKESSYLRYWDGKNLHGCAMSQKLPVNNFEWIKDTSQFNEIFRKNYN